MGTNTKVSLLFNVGAQGWSESFYMPQTSVGGAFSAFNPILGARAALLPAGATLVGIRCSQVNPIGQSQLSPKALISAGQLAADSPWQALKIALFTANGSQRQYELRGIPDALTLGGLYNPNGANVSIATNTTWPQDLITWLNSLSTPGPTNTYGVGAMVRTLDRTQKICRNVFISATGVMSFQGTDPPGWTTTQNFKFYRSKIGPGQPLGGLWTAVYANNVWTIQGWALQPNVLIKSCSVRAYNVTYSAISTFSYVAQLNKRQPGRPFGAVAGRRRRFQVVRGSALVG
jgi:hypothetical protein